MWSEKSTIPDDPLSYAITVTTQANIHTGKLIQELLKKEIPRIALIIEKLHNAIPVSDSSLTMYTKKLIHTLKYMIFIG